MLKAFSLIEVLVTSVIIALSLLFISPIIFRLQDIIAINSEIENIQSFIYQIQNKARFSKENYTLTISQDAPNNEWCIIAIQKPSTKQIICDCLNLNSCNLQTEYHLYKNRYQGITLKNKSLYPKSFINIDGLAGRLESKCINISLNNESEILQFDQWGRIYVSPKNKRSTCKD